MAEYFDGAEPIFRQDYWKNRLAVAIGRGKIHHAIYECSPEVWAAIRKRHHEIMSAHLRPESSVIDCCCGWGRLLDDMPGWWAGDYLGVDISPDFIAVAREAFPSRRFLCADLRDLPEHAIGSEYDSKFDWAIFSGVKMMVRGNAGNEAWEAMVAAAKISAKNVLSLEYKTDDHGEIL